MLIETHLADLRDQTHEIHYEAFRSACITRLTSVAVAQQPQRERRYSARPRSINFKQLTVQVLFSKLKRDSMLADIPSEDVATDLIKQKEEEIRKMQEKLVLMQHQLQQQRSRSLGETQLKQDFSIINAGNDKAQEIRL